MNKLGLKEKINLIKYNSTKRRNIYIVVALLLLLFAGVGYAYLTARLGINAIASVSKNTWDVHFENVVVGENNIEGSSVPTITSNGTDIDFQVALSLPGDVYEFYVDVVNNGSIPAMVQNVGIAGLTDSQKKYIDYKIIYSEGTVIGTKDALPVGGKEKVKVSIKYKENVNEEDLPTEDDNIAIELMLDYEQDDGTSNKRPLYTEYKESILNGAYPVLSDELIPITIASDGAVYKADTSTDWYSYADKRWANAVILKDETKTYNNGDIIPEAEIESYFVWIPRYRYKLWNVDNHATTGVDTSVVHTIDVVFESKAYPEYLGTIEGGWLTHPAFTNFDVNGLWVGKFETGYNGATTTAEAEVNSEDSSKIIIKPDVYSWRGIQVANAFYASYNYKRDLDSHMMKNTEWGAVAYLSHSKYGLADSIRINNNSSFKTGYAATSEPATQYPSYTGYGTTSDVTQLWHTTTGVLASTTGTVYGVYDMSGGTWEYVMGVQLDDYGMPLSGTNNVHNSGFTGTLGCPTCDSNLSGVDSTITSIIGKQLPTSKYYDAYKPRSEANRANGILGDATSELGPFGENVIQGFERWSSSWYNDNSWFVHTDGPWFIRGGCWDHGSGAGVFYFHRQIGTFSSQSFRLVLAF